MAAVELDQYQTIVNVHWPSGEYVAIGIELFNPSGSSVFGVPCGGAVSADPGYNYYGSGYHSAETYNYVLYDERLYSNESWGPVSGLSIVGLRTTDTVSAAAWYASSEGHALQGALYARFTPREGEATSIPVPYETYNFGGVAELTAEALCGLFVGTLGCILVSDPPPVYNHYKAIAAPPVSVFLTSDLAAPIVVTYLGNVLPLVGVSTKRVTGPETPWAYPIGGPATVQIPRVAWLLYRV